MVNFGSVQNDGEETSKAGVTAPFSVGEFDEESDNEDDFFSDIPPNNASSKPKGPSKWKTVKATVNAENAIRRKQYRTRRPSLPEMWDLDGDGELDEAEKALMELDTDGDGKLTQAQVYRVMKEHISEQRQMFAMRKIVVGLGCLTIVLASLNFAASYASVKLLKEFQSEEDSDNMISATNGHVMGTQSAGEDVVMTPLTSLEREENIEEQRRLLGDQRRLKKKKEKCKAKDRTKCDGDIKFPAGRMKETDAEKLVKKCGGSKTVNIKKLWDDGTEDSHCLCKPGTAIIDDRKKKNKKDKDKNSNKNKKKKKKKATSYVTDGRTAVIECDGVLCDFSGSLFLSSIGGPCNIRDINADCEDGLQCVFGNPSDLVGMCQELGRDALWYVDWPSFNCVQDCEGGVNCGGLAQNFNELFSTADRCCSMHLSWQPRGDCVRSPVIAPVLSALPVHQDQRFCAGNGEACYSEANQFLCCSGQCYDDRCA